MKQPNGQWLETRDWQESQDEIHRFLDMWYFHISATGNLYVRPLRPTVTCRDVHAFLKRLDMLGEECLPKTLTFDFSMLVMSPGRWRRRAEILQQYAARINASSFGVSDIRRHGGLALIMRSPNCETVAVESGELHVAASRHLN